MKDKFYTLAQEGAKEELRVKELCYLHVKAITEKIHAFVPKLAGALMMLDVPKFKTDMYVGSSWASWKEEPHPYSYGSLNAHIEGVESWRQVQPIFEALGAIGIDVEKWKSRDDAASYTRIFDQHGYFNICDADGVDLRIHATLKGDTEECRRVLVGYTRPELAMPRGAAPIYELQCKE